MGKDETRDPDPLSPDEESADPAQLRILIVDDEPMLRSVIEEFLSLLGFQDPVMAGDGLQALEKLRLQTFDCMISDIRMPEMALEELLPKVQAEFPSMIVVATSGYSDFQSAMNIIDKGAHDFLGKPLNLDSLEVALSWIAQRRPVLQLARILFGPGTESRDVEADLDRLTEAVGSNSTPFRENLTHAVRIANLARKLETGLDAAGQRDLVIAALLHEMGSSFIMHSLAQQPRQLDASELHLIRVHSRISGRLASHSLGRPEFLDIISNQPFWTDQHTALSEWTATTHLTVWLGLLNFVDGCLRDRPDRMAYTPAQIRESLRRRQQQRPMPPIECLLGQWEAVERFYAEQ